MKYYLYLTDIAGDVQPEEPAFSGWLDASGFSFDITVPPPVSGGGVSSTPTLSTVDISLDLETGLTKVLQNTVTGVRFAEVQLYEVSDTGDANVYVLKNAFIKSLSSGSGTDVLSLQTTSLSVGTGVVYPNNSVGLSSTSVWDLTTGVVSSGPITTPASSTAPVQTIKPEHYYLLVDGVDGGCREAGHVGWFKISSFDLAFLNSGSVQTSIGTMSSTITIDAELGQGLAPLLSRLVKQSQFSARIDGVDAHGHSIFDLKLGEAIVTDLTQGSGADHLSLIYKRVGVTTWGEASDGTLVTTGTFGLNVVGRTPIDASTLPTPKVGGLPALAPATMSDTYTVEIGGSVVIDPFYGVLGNDFDPLGMGLTVTKVNGQAVGSGLTIQGSYGVLSITADGALSYTPKQEAFGPYASDLFLYEVATKAGATTSNAIAILVRNDGNNVLTGSAGADNLFAGWGDDTFYGSPGADMLNGEGGFDTVSYENSSAAVKASLAAGVAGMGGDADGDRLYSVEILIGSSFDDELSGTASNDQLYGGAGADTLLGGNDFDVLTGGTGSDLLDGGSGADVLIGGEDNDTYIVDDAGDYVVETAGGGVADRVYTTVSYTLQPELEELYANGTDPIDLVGNQLNNTISGNSGANRINGGLGNDTLRGNGGADIFVFDSKPSAANVDRIEDFSVVDDTISLENAVFTKLRAGKLASAAFWKGAKAHDLSDRIIYDATKGNLYYDADGTGAAKQVLIATLSKSLTMSAADFFVT